MKLSKITLASAMCIASTSAFVVVAPTISSTLTSTQTSSTSTSLNLSNSNDRRSFLNKIPVAFGAMAAANFMNPMNANAIAGVTVEEFESIMKTAAKSIKIVELSGPKQETAIVTLIDGTQFIISDLIESPSDPRSPLKLIATCRSYNVPTRAVNLEEAMSALSNPGSKKKKVYMNKRVQIAAEKEREKKERMIQDESERVAELERMSQNGTI